MPCSQCVAKNYECQPRCTSRRVRAPRRQTLRNQASTSSSDLRLRDADDLACSGHIPDPVDFNTLLSSNASTDLASLFDFSSTEFLQEPHPSHNNGGPFDHYLSQPSETQRLETNHLSYHCTNRDAVSTNTGTNIFSSIPWNLSDSPSLSVESHISPSGTISAGLYTGAAQLPTPAVTVQANRKSLAISPATRVSPLASENKGSDDVLGDMAKLLARPDVWLGFGGKYTTPNTSFFCV